MVGGKVIEISTVRAGISRLWCIGTGCEEGSECAVNVETESQMPPLGSTVWWQGGRVYWDEDRRYLRKVGFSYDPRKLPKMTEG